VNATPVTLAPFTVTDWLLGLNVSPALLGISVYTPLAKPVKAKLPELSTVVDAVAPPLSAIDAPPPPVIVPATLKVCPAAVKLTPATFAPFI
jgi:hypothetical protein